MLKNHVLSTGGGCFLPANGDHHIAIFWA